MLKKWWRMFVLLMKKEKHVNVEQQDIGNLSTKVYAVTGNTDSVVGSTVLYRDPFLTDEQWLAKVKEDLDEVYCVCAEELL